MTATESHGSVTDGLVGTLNVFVDPATTAKRVPSRLSWLWPVAILCIVYEFFAYQMLPFALQMMDATLTQRNIPAENLERSRSMMHTITSITTPMTPVFVIGFIALYAILVKVVYSMMGTKTRFRDLFSLLAACSLIPMLQYVASFFVLKAKGDPITTAEQITPPFGLDIFFSGVHGPAFVLLSFFSIFQIWFIVVLIFGLAYLAGSSKTKAFIASMPAWLVPLAFRLVGSLFQRSGG